MKEMLSPRYSNRSWFLAAMLCGYFLLSCGKKESKPTIEEVSLGDFETELGPESLKDWDFFEEPLRDLVPGSGVYPYDLNTPLFSDYALKSRFFYLPKGAFVEYHPTEVLEYPEGSVLIKNFYYPEDFRMDDGERRILETRLLVKEEGNWEALSYIWNGDQTDATLEIAGASIPVTWLDRSGETVSIDYSVPNLVQCKSCHEKSGEMTLIGPSARQLNRKLYGKNQLEKWAKLGILQGLPRIEGVPKLPVWNDEKTGDLSSRARAWLEINCAHCHRDEGPAKNTGLNLLASETNPYRFGINKLPVAAGRGSAGLKYSIVRGAPDESILYHRISSLDPGIMMPELGRKLQHKEGLELIRQWISSL